MRLLTTIKLSYSNLQLCIKTCFKGYKLALFTFLIPTMLVSSCKKEDNTTITAQCFTDIATTRQINNKPAKVLAVGSEFYIIEENTIDTRLNPCNLEQAFQVNNLPVTISGDVKTTPQAGICCTDNFVITQIKKR